jgi:predicted dehydrogenase
MLRMLAHTPESCLLLFLAFALAAAFGGCDRGKKPGADKKGKNAPILHHFVVLDPGHFHAALVFQRPRYEGISPDVSIYAPVGEDFADHMARVVPPDDRSAAQSVSTAVSGNRSTWTYRAYLGPDFMETMLSEKAGDIAIISGRNDGKLARITACVNAGMHVLADKPWVIDSSSFARLENVLFAAQLNKRVVYDIMTERYEITTILQRRIIGEPSIFGVLEKGTPGDPAVVKKSVHHISKTVAGRQLKRPGWFFDTKIQGEGLVDVTTHLVDLVFWTLFPEQAVNWRNDIMMFSASRWPTVITLDEFSRITGKPRFPREFSLDEQGNLPYFCNGQIIFKVKGVSALIQVEWEFETPDGGGDTHYSLVRGTKAHVIVLQQKEQNYRPELYVEPAPGADRSAVGGALSALVRELSSAGYPGIGVVEERGRWRIDIPQTYRVGHEAHFGQVTGQFLKYVNGAPMPAWEEPNMLAKYYITTKALEMAADK